MKLYVTPTSPFARKCRIVVRERNLVARVEEVAVDPYGNTPELLDANPIAQVPALQADDGTVLIDSALICAWLDAQADGPPLLPPSGEAHWRARRLETLADAILEMAVKRVLEERRPESERSPMWIARWTDNLSRALDVAERDAPAPGAFGIGESALAVAGLYLDFRLPGLDWRSAHPRLAAFADATDQRPSFAETRPPQ